MGMYDSIEVLYKLPMPENPVGYVPSEGFQTKDLENTLSLYQITEAGDLYIQKTESEWVDGNPNSESIIGKLGYVKIKSSSWERVMHHGEIEIYDYNQTNGSHDYWIEYKLTYTQGKLTNAELIKFEATPNDSRKESDKKFEERLRACAEFRKSKKYRYFFKYTNRCVRFVFGALRKVINFLNANLHKAESFFLV